MRSIFVVAELALMVVFVIATLTRTSRCQEQVAPLADSPIQMFRLLGIEPNEFEKLVDGESVSDSERDIILHVMFHLPRFEMSDLIRWHQPENQLSDLVSVPNSHRVDIVPISGIVTHIEKVSLSESEQRRFRLPKLYAIQLTTSDSHSDVTVWCRDIPKAWTTSPTNDVGYESRLFGFFIKVGPGEKPFFIADRIAWHPTKLWSDMNVQADQRLLGVLGVDIGLFDQIQHATSIKPSDRELFYQFMNAIGHVQKINVEELARSDFDIVELLEQPTSHMGLAYQFEGNARRAIRILVDDEDIQKRFGIDHYYEVETFVSLDRPLTFVDPKTKRDVTFYDYPIVFCVRSLPEGMPEGNNISKAVRMTGFYFKLWAFRNERMVRGLSADEQKRVRALQKAPLFIGLPPEIVATSQARNRRWEIYAGIGFISMLILGWLTILQFRKQDQKFESQRKNRDQPVDFSNLETHE